ALLSSAAYAVPLIRDAEIEHTLRMYGDPIFKAAGLNPAAVHIYIVQDDKLNAFVAGGSNMFLHTGMILACETPDMLMGVMAHETGHIVGGHLARGSEKLQDAQIGSIMTFVLGAAAAAASRQPEAAAAVLSGGQGVVARNFFSFTRANEESADQSALRVLDKLGISSSGMVRVFEMLQRNERGRGGNPDPYMLTHPLTTLRIDHVRNHAEHAKVPFGAYPKPLEEVNQRMIAKLYGFINTPEKTLTRYPLANTSVPARMARAIAYYKMPDMMRSMAEIDGLIAESPKDPFFHELKGQILFENNRPKEALSSYKTAVELLPNSPLLLADLARVELAQKEDSLVPSAVGHLEKSVLLDNDNSSVWRLLATAYGKAGQQGLSALALAEEAVLQDNPEVALRQVDAATPLLRAGSPAAIRARDL
ncbi:MAG: M48 family metalloprotease, partial [Rickettsiales bacterium]|nr:M48 family metalloprotease [Rickettsiales bacterium]